LEIGIIDADLIGRKNQRFPNLACMKLAAYHKEKGHSVKLIIDYRDLFSKYIELEQDKEPTFEFLMLDDTSKKGFVRYYKEEDISYDKILISKVFTDTPIPLQIKHLNICEYGGTGFYYEKAKPLPDEIEHHIPDYHLYDMWVKHKLNSGVKPKALRYFTDYSIGFLTRGCFRKCEFCVNKNYDKAVKHSPVYEFLDVKRPKLCFLDDNFFACSEWKNIIQDVVAVNKKFQFKQGLDERLLSDDKIHQLVSWKYDEDYIFAFDNIADKELIEIKLKRIFELYPDFRKRLKFYVLCGYDRNGKWNQEFWERDIKETFERIFILSKYSALPYIMRYEKCYTSKYSSTYTNLASWCNQPSIFKKFSYKLFCQCRGMSNENYKKYKRNIEKYLNDGHSKGSTWRSMEELEQESPKIAYQYFDIVPDSLLQYGNGKNFTGHVLSE
jgi:hypothetical protein